jgi:hypothetical protein
MNEQESRNITLNKSCTRQSDGEWITADALDLLDGFSERERRHLVFLRWLYRQGRLTEGYLE